MPTGPGGVIDILLLVALPFRLLPSMLPFEPFDPPPMLFLESLAVAPLRPVDVGDGCTFWDEVLEGTWRSPRFLGTSGVSGEIFRKSVGPATSVFSESSVLMVFCAVDVACVDELGGWGASVTAFSC